MTKYVSQDKLGKKAKRRLAAQRRVTWAFSPVTRKAESKKIYNRNRKPRDRSDDAGFSLYKTHLPAARRDGRSAG